MPEWTAGKAGSWPRRAIASKLGVLTGLVAMWLPWAVPDSACGEPLMDSPMPPSLVESERRGGDRVATDIPFFIVCLPPKAKPLLPAVRRHRRVPPLL